MLSACCSCRKNSHYILLLLLLLRDNELYLQHKLTPMMHNFKENISLSHRECFMCWFLGAFAKLPKVTISFDMSVCLSVCPHETAQLPLDGFPRILIFEHSSKICRESSSFIKI